MAKRRQSHGVGEALLPTAPGPHSIALLNDMISSFVDLDLNGLRLQWRNHLGGTPSAHLPRWLLLRILAYRIQAAALGGLDKETLRVIRQPKGQTLGSSCDRPFAARIPATCEGTQLRAGALLTREWNGKLERVIVLDKGFAWNGETYGSLSQVAKAMTGTNWNGHRFFGLRTAKSDRSAKAGRKGRVSAAPDIASIESNRDGKVRRRDSSLSVARVATGETAVVRPAARPNTAEAAST